MTFLKPFRRLSQITRWKHTIDYSKVPVLQDEHLEENFVTGSGPGGSKTYKTSNCVVLKHLPTGLIPVKSVFHIHTTIRRKHTVDYSNLPVLVEKDLEETFVRGSGPGGQNVNKTANCVVLKHVPTGFVVKCHQSRLLQDNQKLARSLLVTKLDNFINGENSVEAQLWSIEQKKNSVKHQKRAKLQKLKDKWKESEREVG